MLRKFSAILRNKKTVLIINELSYVLRNQRSLK